MDNEGYIHVWVDVFDQYAPMRDRLGYVREHRLIMAQHLGRCLTEDEQVHHTDFSCANNKIENLKLFADTGSHVSFHRAIEREARK